MAAATVICVIGFAVSQIFALNLVKLFAPNGSPALLMFAPRAMRIMLLCLPLNGFQVVSANFFVVTGRPKLSILLSMLRQCIALIPCMLIFGRVWGLWGVVTATPVADGFTFLVTGVMILLEIRKLRRQTAKSK
jgi:Na+-driven multidrug efflux pump